MLGEKLAEMGDGLDLKDISDVTSTGLGDRFEKGESGNGGVVYQDEDKEVAGEGSCESVWDVLSFEMPTAHIQVEREIFFSYALLWFPTPCSQSTDIT